MTALAGALASCRSESPVVLEPVLRVGEARGEITARIGDETRYLLAGIRQAVLLMAVQSDLPADGDLSIPRVLGPGLAGAERVVVTAKATLDSRSWLDLPPIVVPVVRKDGHESIDIGLNLPEPWRGRRVQLSAIGWEPDPTTLTSETSELFEVGRGFVLEVGGGVLDGARGQGDVRFRVEACVGGECTEILAETVRGSADQWVDWRVALDQFAGEKITLVFSSELVAGGAGEYSLAVWSRPTVYAPRRAASRRRNVILFSIDTLRADHLSSYGYERDTAPLLREWFEKPGLLFDNTVAAATTTGPSHMTMLTSLVPTVHGITDRPGVRAPAPLTLAEILRADGYATAAVTEDGPLHAGWGFSRGFDAYAENTSSDVMLPEGHVSSTFEKAESWLRRHGDKPFFLFLHTFEVHYPYAPPARYAALFDSAENNPGLPPDYAPELYDREIRHVDDKLDEFLSKLQAAGILDDTIVIVTSDHGEEFLEHGLIGHGANLHPEALHVPLLFRGPGVRGGRRIAAPVGHTDLMPTILALVGVESPAVMMGRNLAAVVGGESGEIEEAPLYSEAWYATAMMAGGQTGKIETPAIAVRRGDKKLIRSKGSDDRFTYQYFDLANDPDERRDLYDENAEAVADLRELLAGYEPLMAGIRRRADDARARFSQNSLAPSEEVDIDPAVSEKLRALGYVE